jgi:uncharacterized protein (TIGR00251 family)
VSAAEPLQPVEVREADGGSAALLPVRLQPGARRRALLGTWNGHLKLAVGAPPQGGRANREMLGLVAELFELRPSAVELVRGHSSRTKVLRLQLEARLCRRRLERLLAGSQD